MPFFSSFTGSFTGGRRTPISIGGGGGGGGAFSVTQTISSPNNTANEYFGYSVDISGDYAIVGAYGVLGPDPNDGPDGEAYILDATDGSILYTLANPDPDGNDGDHFGYAVGISGNYAIVGAHFENNGSGNAYIYDVTDGSLLHTLTNQNDYNTGAQDNFGEAVAIGGNYALVCAPGEDSATGNGVGKAYVYDVTTGNYLRTIDNPNAYSGDNFDLFGRGNNPIGIAGDYAVVGAFNEDDADGSASGKAYVFDLTDGSTLYTLDNPDAYGTGADDRFGQSADISTDYIVIGAPREEDAGGTRSGKAYIFSMADGSLLHTLDNPNAYDTSTNDFFGISVAVDGNNVMVGAYSEDDAGGTSSGKVYLFDATTGSLTQTLDNPNTGSPTSDLFGFDVAIDGEYSIVGAYYSDSSGVATGDVYIIQGVASGGGGGIGAISSLSFVRSGASGATNPFQLKMSSDGTLATWAIGGIGAGSDQYTLSTAWDFSTATKTTSNSTKIIPSGYDANYTSNQMAFSNDGNSLYVNAGVAGGTDRSIFQYNMSTPWSLSTASYASKSFVFTHGTVIGDLIFNNDGSKMYIPRRISGTEFYQYSLSSAYDISTATDDGITFDPGVDLNGLAFNADGTYLYAIYDPGDTNYIKQWSLSTPYDLSTATAGTDVLLGDATTEAAPTGLAFGNDQLHVSGQQFDNVRTYDIS